MPSGSALRTASRTPLPAAAAGARSRGRARRRASRRRRAGPTPRARRTRARGPRRRRGRPRRAGRARSSPVRLRLPKKTRCRLASVKPGAPRPSVPASRCSAWSAASRVRGRKTCSAPITRGKPVSAHVRVRQPVRVVRVEHVVAPHGLRQRCGARGCRGAAAPASLGSAAVACASRRARRSRRRVSSSGLFAVPQRLEERAARGAGTRRRRRSRRCRGRRRRSS